MRGRYVDFEIPGDHAFANFHYYATVIERTAKLMGDDIDRDILRDLKGDAAGLLAAIDSMLADLADEREGE